MDEYFLNTDTITKPWSEVNAGIDTEMKIELQHVNHSKIHY